MPQTLLSFFAIMIVTGMMFGQQRISLQAQADAVNAQFEIMASAVASERIQYISEHPFDARTADGTINRNNKDLNQLTAAAYFGAPDMSGCITASVCKDLDDFDAHQDTVSFSDETNIEFAIDTEVDYVNNDGSVSAVPTWTKEVTVTVRALPLYTEDPFLVQPVTKKRRFSPELEG